MNEKMSLTLFDSSMDTPPNEAYKFFRRVYHNAKLTAQADRINTNAVVSKEENVWKVVTIHETKAFLGMRLYMKCIKVPETKNYWSKDGLTGLHPLVTQTISPLRYGKIFKYCGITKLDEELDNVVRCSFDLVSQLIALRAES